MDAKKIAESGLILAALFVLLYACGVNYYTSILHSYEVGTFFVVPWEHAVGEGIHTVLLFVLTSVVGALVGAVARHQFENSKKSKFRRLIALLLPICFALIVGFLIVFVGRKVGGLPALSVEQRLQWNLRFLAAFTLMLGGFLGFLTFNRASPSKQLDLLAKPRVLAYFLFFACAMMFISAGYYSNLLGKSLVPQIDVRLRARVLFLNDALQQDYKDSWFVPILEKGDDLILVRFKDNQRVERRPGEPRLGELVVIKKSLISSIDFTQ
jgi:hypothetical protein